MKLEIVNYGHPVLREEGQAVEEITDEIRTFARDMIDTMYAADGIGLAAQQVARPLRMFVIDVPAITAGEDADEAAPGEPEVFIDPEIVERTGDPEEATEGCLSFPEIFVSVSRPPEVTVRYRDLSGESREMSASGLLARCIQHEYDHIVGRLMIDHLTSLKKVRIKGQLKRLKKETQASLG